jgi:glycosyltransferase involved in cell wall biosynthesis
MSPPISVIIPAYNAAAWIAIAIESVYAQTLRPAELLVVDNGSTDATVTIAADLGAVVLHEAQKGAAAARNAGLHAANGEWIALLDADDYWLPEKLADQWALIQQFPDIGLSTTNYFFDTNGKRGNSAYEAAGASYEQLPKNSLTPTASRVTIPDLSAQLALGNSWLGLNSSAVLFRKADALAIGGYDPTFLRLEDMEFFARLLPTLAAIALHSTPLVAYRWHGANSTFDQYQMAECHVRFREGILAEPSRYIPRADVWARNTLPRWYRQLALAQLRTRHARTARTALQRSWAMNPNWRTAVLWLGSFFCDNLLPTT